MQDLSISALLTQVPITSVTPSTLQGVPVLDIRVPSTAEIEGVLVQGRDAPFAILSPTRLVAETPAALGGTRIDKLEVRSRRPDPGGTMDVTFQIGAGAATVEGRARALQALTKCLLTRKGSNLWLPNYGTHLSRLVGRAGGAALSAEAGAAVQDAARQVRAYQAAGAPPSEQILSVVVERVTAAETTLYLQLRVRTADGIDTQAQVRGA